MSTPRTLLYLGLDGLRHAFTGDDSLTWNFTSGAGHPVVIQIAGTDYFTFHGNLPFTGSFQLESNILWNLDSGGSIGNQYTNRPAKVHAATKIQAGAVGASLGSSLTLNTLTLGHGDVDKTIATSGILGVAGTPAIKYIATTHEWKISDDGVVWYGPASTTTWDQLYLNDKTLDINDTGMVWTQTGDWGWTWISGSDTRWQSGTYGVKGTPAGTNVPGARDQIGSWVDGSGDFWLFGGQGYDSAGLEGYLNCLWRWDGVNWTWISGRDTFGQTGVYGVKGGPGGPLNIPGGRKNPITWIDGSGDFWLFGGYGFDSVGNQGSLNDLWRWDGTVWTWISGSDLRNQTGVYGVVGVPNPANAPGGRQQAVGWIDTSDDIWLFGGEGYDSAGNKGILNDLWRWDGADWTWISGSNLRNQNGTYGVKGVANPANVPGGHYGAVGWIDGADDLWLCGGAGYASVGGLGGLDDLWRWDGANWTWISGSDIANQPGVYGTKGIADPANTPGVHWGSVSWIDASDNLWLFGGISMAGYLNDVWRWDGTNWTWISGSSSVNQTGVYGTKGVRDPIDIPGSRRFATGQVNASGVVWLFGGDGYDSAGATGRINDLWQFEFNPTLFPLSTAFQVTRTLGGASTNGPLVTFESTGDQTVLSISNKSGTYGQTIDLAVTSAAASGIIVNVNGNTATNSGYEIFDVVAGTAPWRCTLAGNFLWQDGVGAVGAKYTGRPATVNCTTTAAVGAVLGVGAGTRIGLNSVHLGHTDVDKFIYADQAGVFPGLRYEPGGNVWQFSNDGAVWTDIGVAGVVPTWDAIYAADKTLDINDTGLVWTQTGANKGIAFTVTRALTSIQTDDVLVHFSGTGDQSVFKLTNKTDQPGMTLVLDVTAATASGFILTYNGHAATNHAVEIVNTVGPVTAWSLDLAGTMQWGVDGSGSIGAAKATRPNYCYAATGVTVGAVAGAGNDGTRIGLNSIYIGHGDVDKLIYADQGGAPDPALKYNATFNDNWRYSNDGTDYFDVGTGLIYPTEYEGIDKTAPGGIFYVQHSATDTPTRFAIALDYDIGNQVDTIWSDGKNLYCSWDNAGDTQLMCVRKSDGGTVWSVDTGVTAIPAASYNAVFCDGAYFYYGDQSSHELVALNVADGSEKSRVAMNAAEDPLYPHGNGLFVLVGTGISQTCQVFKWIAGSLVYQYKVQHTNSVYRPYCGDVFGVLCGEPSAITLKIARVFTLATGAITYEYIQSWWTGAAVPSGFCAYSDGDFVYLGTTNSQIVGGGAYANVWKLRITATSALDIVAWGTDIGAGAGASYRIHGDDHYIYLHDAGQLQILDKGTLNKVGGVAWGTMLSLAEYYDGEYVIGWYNNGGAGEYRLRGIEPGFSTCKYSRTTSSAVRRFPCQGVLAVPKK